MDLMRIPHTAGNVKIHERKVTRFSVTYYEARQEMNDWLEEDDMPEDTKATMYAQQLQRVKQLKNQVVRPEPSPVQMITHTEQTMTSESDTSEQLSATDKQIIDSVPKTM